MFLEDLKKLFNEIKKANTPLNIKRLCYTIANLLTTFFAIYKLWKVYICFLFLKILWNATRLFFYNNSEMENNYRNLKSQNFFIFLNSLVNILCINSILAIKNIQKGHFWNTLKKIVPNIVFIITVGYSIKFLIIYFKLLNNLAAGNGALKKNFLIRTKVRAVSLNQMLINIFKEEYLNLR